MRYLITGGCGFLGSNLAEVVLNHNDELMIFDNLSRLGSEKNLMWLKNKGSFKFVQGDIREFELVETVIKEYQPEIIFHLAGQVAMTTSLARPRYDFEVNALGTLNVLEAVRQYQPQAIIIYSSTNKVYGDLEWVRYQETATRYITPDFPQGFSEQTPLEFHSPYGCSKGSADQYILDYARIFGVRGVVFRHSSMYGGRQFSSYDQGWLGWFCQQALLQKGGSVEPFTISGNGKQVRDLLHAEDMKSLYFSALKNIDVAAGQVFNIGGGIENSLSLLELFELLETELKIKLHYQHLPPRESDQKVFIADVAKAEYLLKWRPEVDYHKGISNLITWIKDSA